MRQGKNQPIILNIVNSNVENIQIVTGDKNSLSRKDVISKKRKKKLSFVSKLLKMLVKFLTEVDVNIIITLLSMIFTLIK